MNLSHRLVQLLAEKPRWIIISSIIFMLVTTSVGMAIAPPGTSNGNIAAYSKSLTQQYHAFIALVDALTLSPNAYESFPVLIFYYDQSRNNDILTQETESSLKDADSGKNIFTPEILNKINDFENQIPQLKNYKDFCTPNQATDECSSQSRLSMMQTIYSANGSGSLLSNYSDYLIENSSIQYFSIPTRYPDSDKDCLRSLFSFAIKVGDTKKSDRFKKFNDWAQSSGFYDKLNSEFNIPPLKLGWLNGPMIDIYINSILPGDFAFLGGSIVIVYSVLLVQTKSHLLSGSGVWLSIMSWSTANFFLYIVGPYSKSTSLNNIALFLALSIGADDCLIFYSGWTQSILIGHTELIDRLHWTWHSTGSAMLTTTITTFVSFFASAMSPVPFIAIFGMFAALTTLFLYLYTITFYAAVVVVYAEKYENLPFNYCFHRELETADVEMVPPVETGESKTSPESSVESTTSPEPSVESTTSLEPSVESTTSPQSNESKESPLLKSLNHQDPTDPPTFASNSTLLQLFPSGTEQAESAKNKLSKLDRFFYEKVANIVIQYGIHILIFYTIFIAVCITLASFTQFPDQAETALPHSSPIHQAVLLDRYVFNPTTDSNAVFAYNILIGLDLKNPINRETKDGGFLDPNDDLEFGTVNLVPIDLESTLAQNALFQFYDAIDADDEISSTKNSPVCVFFEFRNWWVSEMGNSLPIGSGFASSLRSFIGNTSYLQNGQPVGPQFANSIAFDGKNNDGDIIWCTCKFYAPLPSSFSNSQVLEFYDLWLEKRDKQLDSILDAQNIPPAAAISSRFAWAELTQVLKASTIENILITLGIAFFVLFLMTKSLSLAFLAILTICCIISELMAFIFVIGYKIDITQSLILTISVGLAIDYTLHFAVAYVECLYTLDNLTRKSCVHFALTTVGPPILGGFSTSFFSVAILSLATFPFFSQFALLFSFLDLMSFTAANFLFCPLAMFFGPKHVVQTWSEMFHKK